MNQIDAVVTHIQSSDNINVVSFEAAGQPMRMMALELDRSLKAGTRVRLGVKASNIALGKAPLGTISISNQLKATIARIDNGELLSSVKFSLGEALLESIITRDSLDRMNLQAGEAVVALIKSSELSILERL